VNARVPRGAEASCVRPPAAHPCGSCPYRRDVPAGVWAVEEYEKLPPYDAETTHQPTGVFLCHQQNGRACAGWVAVHDMGHSLALRLAVARGSVDDLAAFIDYSTTTPLWGSGREAAEHGIAGVKEPDESACRVIAKLGRTPRVADAMERYERSGS